MIRDKSDTLTHTKRNRRKKEKWKGRRRKAIMKRRSHFPSVDRQLPVFSLKSLLQTFGISPECQNVCVYVLNWRQDALFSRLSKIHFSPLFANSNFENEFCRDSSFLEYFLQKERKNVDYLLFLLLIHFNHPLQQQQLIQIPSFKGNNPKSLWCGATSS